MQKWGSSLKIFGYHGGKFILIGDGNKLTALLVIETDMQTHSLSEESFG